MIIKSQFMRIAAISLISVAINVYYGVASAQDENLREVQELLAEEGYGPGPADGFIGPRTKAAIEDFQRDNDIPQTSELDAATLGAFLSENSITPAQKRTPAAAVRSNSPSATQSMITNLLLWCAVAALVYLFFVLRSRKRHAVELPKRDVLVPKSQSRAKAEKQISSDRHENGQSLLGSKALDRINLPKKVYNYNVESNRRENATLMSSDSESTVVAVDAARKKLQAQRREAIRSHFGKWHLPGTSAIVHGRNIGDMVYTGVAPRIDAYGTVCGAVIDPSLSIAKKGDDFEGVGMSYWPKYSEITAKARATYLDWLTTGRNDQRYNVGYCFLYFYGLERRYFKDKPAVEEKHAIIADVIRLLRIYGENGSIRTYLSKFIDVARLCLGETKVEPLFENAAYDFPLSLSVSLGRRVAREESITAEWALSWFLCHPERRLRTPARRCKAEFRALFQTLYDERYPDGIKIRRPKKELKASYRAASGEFHVDIDLSENGKPLPDISGLRKPVNDAQKIANDAMDALDKYSRFLGGNPDGRRSLEAWSLLPLGLRDVFPSDEVEELKTWAKNIASADGQVKTGNLIKRLAGARPEKLSRRHLIGAADALSLLGFGMAPDPRFAFRAPKLNEPVILFPIPDNAGISDSASDAYRAAVLELGLGTFVAQADGEVAPSEETALRQSIENANDLSDHELARLRANLSWMLAVPPDLRAFRKRLKDLTAEESAVIRQVSVAMANADGVIRPGEISGIEKIYRAMGIDPGEVYSDLHAGAIADEPITVRLAQSGEAGEPILVEAAISAVGLSLDRNRIADIVGQTKQASQLLGSILSGNLPEEPEAALENDQASSVFDGLDPKHASIVAELIEKLHWTDDEYKVLVSRRSLMIHGSLEAINEWSFERFDDALIEEYDGFEINLEIAAALKNMQRDTDNA